MQEINAEYDELMKNPGRIGERTVHREERRERCTWDWTTYSTMPSGPYCVQVTNIRENHEKEYVALVFDILKGPYKGHFMYSPWFRHCIYLKSATDWQRENARRIMLAFYRSNRGFDSSAVGGGDWSQFVGKKVGIILSQQYIDGSGKCFISSRDIFPVEDAG